jgi:hypothetical protein
MVWLQVAALLQASVAVQVRLALKVFPQKPVRFVVVVTTMFTLVPSHTSKTAGGRKFQTVPHSTVRSGAQVRLGAVVSTTTIVWLHVLLFVQGSVARHVRVALKVLLQKPPVFVRVFRIVTFTFVPAQASNALGAVKFQTIPHSTTRLLAHTRFGGVVSITVIVWLHVLLLLQGSLARQVRVALKLLLHPPLALVTVLTIVIVTFVPAQMSKALGWAKFQTVPHSTT